MSSELDLPQGTKCEDCCGNGFMWSEVVRGRIDCSYCLGKGYIPFPELELRSNDDPKDLGGKK